MHPLQNDRLLKALLREPVDVTPVWLMRQAGRYLPEYRKVRKQAGSFMDLCSNPELACEVTLQPVERYPLDAAILFSDILTVPDAMGLGLYFEEGEGPCFEKPVRRAADVQALGVPDPESELRYVMDAVRLIRRVLDNRIPLIGFAGSPWTLATYMVEGGSHQDVLTGQGHAVQRARPAAPAAGVNRRGRNRLPECAGRCRCPGPDDLRYLGWRPDAHVTTGISRCNYMERIVDGLTRENEGRQVPVILFTKGGGQWLEAMADTGCRCPGRRLDRPTSARRAGGWATASRCRATLIPATLYGLPRSASVSEVAGCSRPSGRIRSRLQPRPRHHTGC